MFHWPPARLLFLFSQARNKMLEELLKRNVHRSAKRRGCLLSYSQAEPGRELTQPSPRLLAEPCTVIYPFLPDGAQHCQPFEDGDDVRIHHISPSGTGCTTLPTEKRATCKCNGRRVARQIAPRPQDDTLEKLLFVSGRPSVGWVRRVRL